MGLRALVGKMALFVTVVTGGPAQVPILPTRWLVAAIIISSRGFGCVDPSGWSGALRFEVAGAAIAIILIALTLLVVPAKSFSLDGLGAMKKHDSCLLGAERKGISVPGVIFSRF